MFKQFLKNWDDAFHDELGGNQKRLSDGGKSPSLVSSLNTLDDINMLSKIRKGSESQSYMEIENDFQDQKTQTNTLMSSLAQFSHLKRRNTFTRRLGKDWKMQSQIEKTKTHTTKFLTFKCFVMTKYNSQNV